MSPDGPIKPPPEERLLKLIRGRGAKPAEPAAAAPGEAAPAAVVVAARPRALRMATVPWFAMAVGGLSVVLALELVWLVVQAVRPLPEVPLPATEPGHPAAGGVGEGSAEGRSPRPTEPGTPPTGGVGEGSPENEVRGELPSLAASVSRPLFVAAAKTGPAGPAGSTPGPLSGTAQQLSQRLTLMGIVSGESPQAIIEDSQTKKTYFVTIGQAVTDGAVVDEIQDTRVILTLAGEKIELIL